MNISKTTDSITTSVKKEKASLDPRTGVSDQIQSKIEQDVLKLMDSLYSDKIAGFKALKTENFQAVEQLNGYFIGGLIKVLVSDDDQNESYYVCEFQYLQGKLDAYWIFESEENYLKKIISLSSKIN